MTVEVELAIMRTLSEYCLSLDYGRADDWADCFTSDGIYHCEFPDGDVRHIVGRANLRAYALAHAVPPESYPKHQAWAPVIKIAGSRAYVESLFAIYGEDSGGPRVRAYGRYKDTMFGSADGIWRFGERVAYVESISSDFRRVNGPSAD
jgi:hypothetical protein